MCGCYYVDDETAREIEKIIQQVDENLRKEQGRDIRPGDKAPILITKNGKMGCTYQKWGFPVTFRQENGDKKQLLFNARSESVLDKPSFKDSVLKRRAVIPATRFYEWSRNKEKNIFSRMDSSVLYMAGCFQHYEDGEHFVILTTAANDSMLPVHDRMPLILENDEVRKWILDEDAAKRILQKEPCRLERKTDYEQMSLF